MDIEAEVNWKGRGVMDKIDKLVQSCLKDNIIGEAEILPTKTIFTWLLKGREKAEKVSLEAVKNLVENGFVDASEKKLVGEIYNAIGLSLMIAGAQGFIKQTSKE